MKEQRRFIRHPTEIPIELLHKTCSVREKNRLNNISLGGLAFSSTQNWQQGTIIGIRIPLIDPEFETTGKVVWCQKKNTQFDVGVEITNTYDAFRVRMVEQVCQIEKYRNQLKQQGRILSSEEAATEWITYYAAEFPSLEIGKMA
jgi:Tfp pilus assembly protein PilZ